MANSREVTSAISTDMLSYSYLSAGKISSLIPKEFTVRHAEVVGWRPMVRLQRIVTQLRDVGIDVSDFHLRTGPEARSGLFDTLKILALQQLIHSADAVVKKFPQTPLLLHAPEAASPRVFRSILRYRPSFLWVENHKKGLAGILEAKRLVHLYRANGIRSAIMFDGAHEIGPETLATSRNFRTHWDGMLAAKMDSDVWGEHVPVGTDPTDAFPLSHVSDAMWNDYARCSSPNLKLRVVENQQHTRLLYISKRALPSVVKRNGEIYSLLQRAGVVKFE